MTNLELLQKIKNVIEELTEDIAIIEKSLNEPVPEVLPTLIVPQPQEQRNQVITLEDLDRLCVEVANKKGPAFIYEVFAMFDISSLQNLPTSKYVEFKDKVSQ